MPPAERLKSLDNGCWSSLAGRQIDEFGCNHDQLPDESPRHVRGKASCIRVVFQSQVPGMAPSWLEYSCMLASTCKVVEHTQDATGYAPDN